MSHLPTTILVPVSLDGVSRRALSVAAEVARTSGARLHVMHVWLVPYAEHDITADEALDAGGNLFERARYQCAQELQAFITSAGVDPSAPNVEWSIHSGSAAAQILAHCQTLRCDWIVMGTHRHRGLSHWLLGSVAEEVLRHSRCPVLVVPAEHNTKETRTLETTGELR